MLKKLKRIFSSRERDDRLQDELDRLRQQTPVPVFWLYGKTQSGKTSLIKYFTGADEAEIGQGFRPCTRFSRQYQFPTTEAPLLTFLDTRGLGEPGYQPDDDLAHCDKLAQVVIVTVKVTDHALESIVEHLRTIRKASPTRPVILVLTCLHEAYPQQQHVEPYPFVWHEENHLDGVPEPLERTIEEHRQRFEGLVDRIVPVDLTRPEEGYENPTYGGPELKQVLVDVLPAAYRHTLLALQETSQALQDLYAQHALPHIFAYSSMAATAGAIPVPWLDMFILPGIQTRMIYHLAKYYGQPLDGARFVELASTLGMGMLARQAARGLIKFIPYVGSIAGAAFAGASTFALGKAFCYYYSAVHKGHVPKAEDLRKYYKEQLALAEQTWKNIHKAGKK